MPSSSPLITHSVAKAAQWLNAGKLLAYPTESVWGIGCDPFDKSAVQQLLDIKQRPISKGMIVVTDKVQRIEPLLALLSDEQRQTVLDSWSQYHQKQAFTWLLPLGDPLELTVPIPSWITGAHQSVAVRVIAHPLIQQLCACLVSAANPYGFLVSTSCNPSEQPPAVSLTQAQAYFVNNDLAAQVGYLQGDTLGYILPSQIHDALTGTIIR
ncbi:Sua5/YciO/YrdC/YwlC family protein [Psychrobacter sp. AH5]|uniref:L-threonylcarbamoyladenylate synthase n=1 Tax=Psychrobacter sp. AH5 TaxID=2937433 RepID=UPI0033410BCE